MRLRRALGYLLAAVMAASTASAPLDAQGAVRSTTTKKKVTRRAPAKQRTA